MAVPFTISDFEGASLEQLTCHISIESDSNGTNLSMLKYAFVVAAYP
jgi:hypothetical protein